AKILERSSHPGMIGATGRDAVENVRGPARADLLQVWMDEAEVESQVRVVQEILDMSALVAPVEGGDDADEAGGFQIPQMLRQLSAEGQSSAAGEIVSVESQRMFGQYAHEFGEMRLLTEVAGENALVLRSQVSIRSKREVLYRQLDGGILAQQP